ncbi:MAG TPA: c-type cytochrome [Gaiellaceae bacterium]|nr:c-type cytochrome [Gaiellaceae bacterium]
MIFALSTSHKIGLATTGAVFILYSLVSAFVLPARNPNFPGRFLKPYIALSIVMFLAMIGAVLVFGKESKEATPASAATTTPAATTTTGGATTSTTGGATGDPVAGKAVFASAGCNACHVFKAAGSSGTIGPDLDHLADYATKAGEPLAQFTKEAIVSPPAKYVPTGFPTNVMPTTFGKSLSATQLNDLVAFLTQG